MIRLLPLVVFFLFLSCCDDRINSYVGVPSGPGIYFWKTTLELDEIAIESAKNTGFSQLFLRTGDIDWNYNTSTINSKGLLKVKTSGSLGGLRVTPVLYLVNRVLREHHDPTKLGVEIGKFLTRFEKENSSLVFSNRWQIDCDWTPGTRDAYFSLLRQIKLDHPNVLLSATIRLHQYRERVKNGIPPVDEGLLMCYNMTPIDDITTFNSIFDPALLAGYLKAPTYPLPLDAALPVFEWGAAFRNGQFIGIVDPPENLNAKLIPVGPGRFLIGTETTSLGTLLRPGDDLRHDGPMNALTLQKAANSLRDRAEIRDIHIFDWNPNAWKKFEVYNYFTTE